MIVVVVAVALAPIIVVVATATVVATVFVVAAAVAAAGSRNHCKGFYYNFSFSLLPLYITKREGFWSVFTAMSACLASNFILTSMGANIAYATNERSI